MQYIIPPPPGSFVLLILSNSHEPKPLQAARREWRRQATPPTLSSAHWFFDATTVDASTGGWFHSTTTIIRPSTIPEHTPGYRWFWHTTFTCISTDAVSPPGTCSPRFPVYQEALTTIFCTVTPMGYIAPSHQYVSVSTHCYLDERDLTFLSVENLRRSTRMTISNPLKSLTPRCLSRMQLMVTITLPSMDPRGTLTPQTPSAAIPAATRVKDRGIL